MMTFKWNIQRAVLCLLLGTYSLGAFAVDLPLSIQSANAGALKELLSPSARISDKVRFLEIISHDEVARRSFLELLRSEASSQELLALKTELPDLSRNIRSSPVSYGFAGGLRSLALVGLFINIRLMVHGFNSSFINRDSPVVMDAWTTLSSRVDHLFLLGLAITIGADLLVYLRENPLQKDYVRTKRALEGFLKQIDGVLSEINPATASSLNKSQSIRDRAEILSSASPAELKQALSLMPEEERNNFTALFHADAPGFEAGLQQEVETWLAAHSGVGRQDLVRKSFELEDLINENLSETHRLSFTEKLSLSVLGINAMIWGALTNMGLKPAQIDWMIPGFGNVDQWIRDTWMHHNKIGAAAFLLAGGAFAITYPFRSVRQKEKRRENPAIAGEAWRFLRKIILRAERPQKIGTVSPSENQTASNFLKSLVLSIHRSKTPLQTEVRLSPQGWKNTCYRFIGKILK